jgi:hypothetical protein
LSDVGRRAWRIVTAAAEDRAELRKSRRRRKQRGNCQERD